MDEQVTLTTYGNRNLSEGTEGRPLVTFAVFAYNQEKYIRDAVEGAFSQDYSPLEIILSDDCSSDGTFEIMKDMAQKYRGPHLIRLRQGVKNVGTLSHLLSVARLALGRFFVVAAGDDISLGERTQTIAEVMQSASDEIVVASSDDIIFNDQGKTYDSEAEIARRREYFSKNLAWFHGATACYDTEMLRALPVPDEKILFEDMALMAIFSNQKKKSLRVERSLIRRRSHSGNVGPIRELELNSPKKLEISRLRYIYGTSEAYFYAADAVSFLGGNGRQLRRKATFLKSYSNWLEKRFLSRLLLVLQAVPHGYMKAALIRLPGPNFFYWVKSISERNRLSSRT